MGQIFDGYIDDNYRNLIKFEIERARILQTGGGRHSNARSERAAAGAVIARHVLQNPAPTRGERIRQFPQARLCLKIGENFGSAAILVEDAPSEHEVLMRLSADLFGA